MGLVILGVNSLWQNSGGLRLPLVGEVGAEPSQAQVHAFWHLERKVEAFLETESLSIMSEPVSTIFEKEVAYGGELVCRARALTWEQVEPALPPRECCASVDVLELCDARMRHFLSSLIQWSRYCL